MTKKFQQEITLNSLYLMRITMEHNLNFPSFCHFFQNAWKFILWDTLNRTEHFQEHSDLNTKGIFAPKRKLKKKKNEREKHITANPSFTPCPSVHRNPHKPEKNHTHPNTNENRCATLQKIWSFFLAAVYVHEQDKSYRGTEESHLIRIQILSMCHCSSYGRRKNGNLKRHY